MQSTANKIVNRPAVSAVDRSAAVAHTPSPLTVVHRSAASVQTSLKVSKPSDPAEKEAEGTARKIMRMSDPSATTVGALRSPYLQRFAIKQKDKEQEVKRKGTGELKASAAVSAEIQNSASGGSPLPASVKAFMEPRFRADFSRVRIQTGEKAAKLSRQVQAHAFTYGNTIFFGQNKFKPDTSEGRELIAHELTHVIQQGHAVQRSEDVSVTHSSEPSVQRLGLSDALNYFADAANNIPGYTMFTFILGVNPINMSRVERNAINLFRAIIGFLPGGNLIFEALQNHGVLDRVGAWVQQQLDSLGMTGSSIRQAINNFLDSLSWSDIFDLGGVWDRAKRIFTEPIGRIISFVGNLAVGILRMIKDAILRPLARLAEGTRGYDLLKAVLGEDPVTGDPVPRTAETLIGGFMRLIGQEEVWENIQRANAIPRAWAWFQGALSGLMGMVRQIPGLFISAFQSLTITDIVLLPRAFARVASVFGTFIGNFLSWAGGTVISLLEIIFAVVAPGAVPYIQRAAGAFRTIIQNPIGFVGNLVRAAMMGFRQFAANFLRHLRASLIQWLTGALPGVYIPTALNFQEIVKFILSVLGLTWQNIRTKLVRAIGETAVVALETGFEIVQVLVTQGPAAAWERIRETLSNLQQMVIDGVMEFVRSRIIQAAVTRLLSMLSPAGAFIQAIIAIYNTIMFFIERLRQIAQVAMSFIDSIAAIAAGSLAAAANRVEQTMAGLLTLVISFLARIAGLGRVSDAIMNLINRVRQPIDRALDRVVAWIVNAGRRFLTAIANRVRGGGRAAPGAADTRTPEQKQAAIQSALRDSYALLNNEEMSIDDVNQRLPDIRTRYQLRTLALITEAEQETEATVHVHAEVNPVGDSQPKRKRKLPPLRVNDKVQVQDGGDWSPDFIKITRIINQNAVSATGTVNGQSTTRQLNASVYGTEWRKYNPYRTGDAWEAIKNLNAWSSYADASQTLSYRKHNRFNVPGGKNWHHIHEQNNGGPNTLANLALVDASINQGALNAYFRRTDHPGTNGVALRVFLRGKPAADHRTWGLAAITAAGKTLTNGKDEGRGPYNEIE